MDRSNTYQLWIGGSPTQPGADREHATEGRLICTHIYTHTSLYIYIYTYIYIYVYIYTYMYIYIYICLCVCVSECGWVCRCHPEVRIQKTQLCGTLLPRRLPPDKTSERLSPEYVDLSMCVCVHMYLSVYACICIYRYTYVYMYVCMYVLYICVCVNVYIRKHPPPPGLVLLRLSPH